MEIDIANIISAAGTLLAAYFAYNQYTNCLLYTSPSPRDRG